MARPTFIARTKANPYGVFLFNDFETIQVGTSPTGIADHATTSSSNKIIQIQNDLYFLGGQVLRKYNRGTTNWDTVYHPAPNPTNKTDSGIFFIPVNGVPHLCWIYCVDGNTFATFRGVKYNLVTGATTETSNFSAAGNIGYKTSSVVYNGAVYWAQSFLTSSVSPLIYNPATNTLGANGTGGVVGGVSTGGTSLCIYNKQLYCLTVRDSSNRVSLSRWNGNNFGFIASLDTPTAGGGTSTAQGCVLFTDRTYLYAIFPKVSATAQNYLCVRIDSLGSTTDITSTVLPSELTGNTSASSRAWCYVNNEDSQTNPEIFIYIALSATAGGTVAKYKWNGSAAPITLVGIGGDLSYSFSDDLEGAGHRSYTTNEPDILIRSVEQSSTVGAVKVNLNIFESSLIPSGTPCVYKIFVDADFEHPQTECILSNPQPSGTVINSTTVTSIVIGSGINYSVDWKPTLNGITPNQAVKLVPWVSGII